MAFVSSGASLQLVKGNGKRAMCSQVTRMVVLNPQGSGKEMKEVKEMKPGDKASYCRCWASKKFPLCDGSHNAHNKEAGDNIGPIVVDVKPQ
mmetsp:Transcript_7976/g.14164  ORF Transcript_7976/g.14164 Transcript_7976/m.14164 type:complete len:92 (-) Transcript_7976:175-450(-)